MYGFGKQFGSLCVSMEHEERENNSHLAIIMGANLEIERKFHFFGGEHKKTLMQRWV